MSYTVYSVETLTDNEALEVADAYIKGQKDPLAMARTLGVDSFDLNLIMHPLVRGHIIRIQRAARAEYSLYDHMTKLKEIRDAALEDENFKVALQAEAQLGKVAGHYDPRPAGDEFLPGGEVDLTKLSTQQIRQRLAKSIGAVIPAEAQPAAPELLEVKDDENLDDLI